MSEVTIIGIDLAKRIFHLHLAGHDGFVVFRKRLSRGQLPAFMSQVPQCVVAMETCATAHSWEQVWEQGSRVYNYFIIFKGQLGLCGGGGVRNTIRTKCCKIMKIIHIKIFIPHLIPLNIKDFDVLMPPL